MRVMVMVKASRGSEAAELPSEQLLTEMGRYNEELVRAGIMLSGEGLQPSSQGVRVRFSGDRRTVTDGPFAETKELVAGFWMWRVKSMAEAIDWVKRCPNPMMEDSDIEIRPVYEADDLGEAFTPELREQEASLRASTLGLGELRFEAAPERRVVGLNRTYAPEQRAAIPEQWVSFIPYLGTIPGQVGATTYGVCWNPRPGCVFDYLTGVEVGSTAPLPEGFSAVQLPAGRYAIYTHTRHISELGAALDTLWSQWAPDCGLKLADSPSFERYTEEFNPQTGLGGTEVWIPLEG